MSYSKHSFIGRLTKDPEVKQINVGGQPTSVANFTVAVDKDRSEGADFYEVVAWRGLADNVGKFLGKGRLVLVEGRPTERRYNITKDNVEFEVRRTEVQADIVQFLDRAPQADGDSQSGNQGYVPPTTNQPTYSGPAPF